MRQKFLIVCLLFMFAGLTSCEPETIDETEIRKEDGKGNSSVADPDDGSSVADLTNREETKVAENDTCIIYALTNFRISNITLESIPDPAVHFAERLYPYRMPTRLEATILRNIPIGIDPQEQRCLCYDDPKDDIIKGSTLYGTGYYYTFNWKSTAENSGISSVTKAGFKTKYCIIPIRTVSIKADDTQPDTPPNEEIVPENPPTVEPPADDSEPEDPPEKDFNIEDGILIQGEGNGLIGD